MKVIAFNGSPRKNWNTAILLKKALEGAASKGAETEFVHLNELTFKGCQSCFSCKRVGGKSYGTCATKDDLTPYLQKVQTVDAIILGSPMYLGAASASARAVLERLVFPYLVYDNTRSTLFPRRIKTACIYAMNMTEERVKAGQLGFDKQMEGMAYFLKKVYGPCESLCSYDTYQFDDYSKYHAPRWDPAQKLKRRQEVFPGDCQKAFELGVRLATPDTSGPKP